MTQKLIHGRSSVANAVPTSGQMEDGQIFMNQFDKLLFIKDNTGAVIKVASAAAVTAALSSVQTVNGKTGPNVTLASTDIGANGVAPLDTNSKIPLAYLPDSVLGSVIYQGTWDASTNTPTLASPPDASTKGHYYVVTGAGTQFGLTFTLGDWIISNGAAWEKVDAQDTVSSVNGKTGAVVLNAADVGALALTGGTVTGAVTFQAEVTVPAPVNPTDASTKKYVDDSIAALPAGGTVTSVAVTAPTDLLTVSGSPITTNGTIDLALKTQSANLVFAGPGTAGSADAAPTFRALTGDDLPPIDEGVYAS